MIEEQVSSDTITAEINKFLPNSKHFVRILAYNSRFNGPHSQPITVVTPEGGKFNWISYLFSFYYVKIWFKIYD